MAILNNNPLVGASGNQGGYNINNSLRFRSSASAYLSRTPVSAGNRRTFTFSAWVKRGILTDDRILYSGTVNGSTQVGGIFFNGGDDNLRIIDYQGSALWNVATTQKFRDPSAWYHIVVAVDTTQATASNRVKMYVNGNQVTAFAVANYPSQNTDTFFNYNAAQALGRYSWSGGGGDFDGYMAEVNFIDGLQKAASDFGETDTTTGVWKPKAYTGTYGTNGFYLKFSDIATTSGSNAGLGKDFSGNSNYWTTNNISVTSGTTYDAMTDSPTLTSATVANYAVLNPLTLRSGTGTVSVTTSNANLTWNFQTSGASPQNYMVSGTIGMSSGKWYWEMTPTTITATTGLNIGIGANPYSSTNFWATDGNSTEYFYASNSGNKGNNGSSVAYGSSYTVNDVIGVALDMDAGTLTFYKNNVSQGTAFTGLTGTYFPFIACPSSAATDVVQVNFGQRPFSYTPPTGYVALNTYNLPTPTILQGNKYMDATLYTGTGSAQTITNAGAFKPDFVWQKARAEVANHRLVDSVRGVDKVLYSSSTAAEATTDGVVDTFNSNGFTGGGSDVVTAGNAAVAWQWQAGQGSTSSNTSGSITSTVSVNTTAGFSVVTYTGTGSTKTFGHGLGVTPAMFIVKSRSQTGENWVTWHKSFSNTAQGNMALNTTDAVSNSASVWGNTAPTSTLITVGNSAVNNNTSTYVCYAWAEIAGFSKFGSYTGNGSADGTFVYLGFRPKWIIIRPTNAISSWTIEDTARSTYNVMDARLFAEGSDAEVSNGNGLVDYLSNGFKPRVNHVGINGSGNTYIYAAFAENPFKNSLAR